MPATIYYVGRITCTVSPCKKIIYRGAKYSVRIAFFIFIGVIVIYFYYFKSYILLLIPQSGMLNPLNTILRIFRLPVPFTMNSI